MRLLPVVCAFVAWTASAQTKLSKENAGVQEPGVRKGAFSVGVAGLRHSLKAGDGNEVVGNAGAVQLGTGYIAESWYAAMSLDILLGPYEPTQGGQLNVDYVGTGVTVWTGVSAQTMDLRSVEGGYGFALGLSYADSVGRSIGKNRKETGTKDDDHLVDNYNMRVNNLSLLPAIFFSWLSPARPRGNTPELLRTRLEGYFLTLGMAMPLLVNYTAKFDERGAAADAGPKNQRGNLRGYSILMSFTAMLGI